MWSYVRECQFYYHGKRLSAKAGNTSLPEKLRLWHMYENLPTCSEKTLDKILCDSEKNVDEIVCSSIVIRKPNACNNKKSIESSWNKHKVYKS